MVCLFASLCYLHEEKWETLLEWVLLVFFCWVENWSNGEQRIEIDKSIPCIEVEREALSYTPLWAHSFRKFKRSGVPGIGLPRAVFMSKPMLNMAMPELLSTHGKCTLNSVIHIVCTSNSVIEMIVSQTFGILWNFPFNFNRNRRWLQNVFIQWLQPIEMVVISFSARTPCEIHAAHFRRYYGQIIVEIRTFQMHRHSAIVNGKDFHWET